MNWTTIDTWIVIIGSLCAAGCAVPGTVLVLRRMSLMGDAISHTVLPGIAIAFLVTGSRDPIAMLIGSVVLGLLTAFLVQAIHSLGKVEVGASMGIVFTVLFAFGLVLMRQAIDHVDIDPDCVLNGAIEFAWFDQDPDGWGIPRGAIVNGVMLLVNALVMLLLYKEFKITAFDPALAKTQGISPAVMHYILMTMTAATAVAAFETVGSILVVAMFVVPPATAYILTDRYGVLIVLSLGIGVLAAGLGHLSAITVPTWFGFSGTTTAGAMATIAGVLFLFAWIFSPSQGLLASLRKKQRRRALILHEDVLGFLWRVEERNNAHIAVEELPRLLSSTLRSIKKSFRSLCKAGEVRPEGGTYVLTQQGRKRAVSLVRSHRLWEVYLGKHFPQDAHQLHHSAERLEHVTTDEMQTHLGDADIDPHGRRVPRDE